MVFDFSGRYTACRSFSIARLNWFKPTSRQSGFSLGILACPRNVLPLHHP
jgi:hypothetical protein